MSGAAPRSPNPRAVLALAAILPGTGHVWIGMPRRGLGFALFILLMGGATLLTAGEDASTIGRLSGGLFVWAMSLPDAYRLAALRRAHRQRSSAAATAPVGGDTEITAHSVGSAPGVNQKAKPHDRGAPLARVP